MPVWSSPNLIQGIRNSPAPFLYPTSFMKATADRTTREKHIMCNGGGYREGCGIPLGVAGPLPWSLAATAREPLSGVAGTKQSLNEALRA